MKRARLVGVLAGLAVVSPNVWSQDTIKPFVEARVTQEDNLLRLADSEKGTVANGNEDELILTLGAGVDVKLPLSRQEFFFNGRVDRHQYDVFTDLDHTTVNALAGLNLNLGGKVTGKVAYDHEERMSRFEERDSVTLGTTQIDDINTDDTISLDLGYQFHPDWKLIGGGTRKEHEEERRPQNDNSVTGARVGFQFLSLQNTMLGALYSQSEVDFDLQPVPNNDFDSDSFSVIASWQRSHSQLEAALGRTEISFQEGSDRDFDSTTWRLSYGWKPTAKFRATVDFWNEARTGDEVNDAFEELGFEIEPVLALTEKISLRAGYRRTEREFKGQTGDDGSARDDELTRLLAAVTYRPIDPLRLTLSIANTDRSSNAANSQFEATTITFRARMDF